MPQYFDMLHSDMPASALPDAQYLLQVAAKSGQAEAIRFVFEALPKDTRQPHHPWDPAYGPRAPLNDMREEWRLYEDGIVYSALEGADALSVFKLFFEYGMEADYHLDRAWNATAVAISHQNVDLVRFFFSKGAKLAGYCSYPDSTYLGNAASKVKPDMLNFLLEHGAELKDSQALRHAVQFGQVRNAEILLELGEDINEAYTRYDWVQKRDENWGRPLHWAVIGPFADCLESQASKAETVRFLLSRGAKADVIDKEGKTPFQLAVDKDERVVLDVFKEFGVER